VPIIESVCLGADELAAAFVGANLVWSPGLAFNPTTALPWLHVGWADDPDMLAAYADGDPVDAWLNKGSVGSSDPAATGTERPTMRHSVAGLNGHAGIEFVTGDSSQLEYNIVNISQPFRRVIVYVDPTATSSRTYWGTGASISTGGIGVATGGSLYSSMASGTITVLNPAPTGTHIVSDVMNDTSSKSSLDGGGYISGGSGTNQLTWLGLGGSASSTGVGARFMTGHIAFWGVLDGSVSDGDVEALVDDLMGYYEIPPP
jgi:hypothetical protein